MRSYSSAVSEVTTKVLTLSASAGSRMVIPLSSVSGRKLGQDLLDVGRWGGLRVEEGEQGAGELGDEVDLAGLQRLPVDLSGADVGRVSTVTPAASRAWPYIWPVTLTRRSWRCRR